MSSLDNVFLDQFFVFCEALCGLMVLNFKAFFMDVHACFYSTKI